MAGFTKEKALWIIVECAKQYKENLADRTLLFVCTDREKRIKLLEVSFDASNYLHLTGCKLSKQITAQDFFQRCLEHRLSVEDFVACLKGYGYMIRHKDLFYNLYHSSAKQEVKWYLERSSTVIFGHLVDELSQGIQLIFKISVRAIYGSAGVMGKYPVFCHQGSHRRFGVFVKQ